MISKEELVNLVIVDCCTVCVFSPFKGSKKRTAYCKKVGRNISMISKCDLYYEPDGKAKRKRLGGIKAGAKQIEKLI